MTGIDDRELAGRLAATALVEIRHLAGRPQGEGESGETLKRIRFLANLTHNLPMVANQPARRSARGMPPSRSERAMRARPMSWTWNTSEPEERAWILAQVEEEGLTWTPPPPLPRPSEDVPVLRGWQRIGLPLGWPVKTPPRR
ncbi:hypothetical protein [Umezawaea sp. Da 62-37]|uniref:hypothetical protein n=1 Tax=Umezawaea sp. Da 62-37 TaxID=3075927 RepID=UPI0028F6E7C4|nr:hypothetical protein [Umezawaea sp. Da 62-37]WNV88064.1 hypothetical protein RM788_07180 [Umezawaea sp. Da 62-37]